MDAAHFVGALIPIVICVAFFATVFGIYYLRSKENMALIERGINPKIEQATALPRPFLSLKYGLLLIGCGLGLFLALICSNMMDSVFPSNDETPVVYFSLIAIFGGLGLVLSYNMERKHLKEIKAEKAAEAAISVDL